MVDSVAIHTLINKISILKFKFAGVFAADTYPTLSLNTFQVVNSATNTMPGQHWVLLANIDGKIYFGDSLGRSLEYYTDIYMHFPYSHVYRMMEYRVQDQSVCGFYCIYFAWTLFSGVGISKELSDFHLLRFIDKYNNL